MARPDKAASVAEITEAFQGSSAAVITEYRGLRVAEMKELRRALGGDVQYAVVKNTLTKIAAKEAGLDIQDDLLAGPTAIAFIKGDPVLAAKGLRDFAKTHPLLVIKGGVLDDRALSADEIRKLADLESRETLLAKLAGAMNASLQQAVSLFAAPLSQAARLAAALRDKVEQEGPVGGAAGASDAAPAADATDTATDEATDAASDAAPAADATDAGTVADAAGDAAADATADAAPAAEDTPAEAPAADAAEAPAAEATDTTDTEAAAPAAEPTA